MMPTRLQFLSFANKKRIFIRVLYYSFFVSFLFAERGAALRRLRQQGIEATQPAQVSSSTTRLPHKVFSRKKIKKICHFFSVFIPLALREKKRRKRRNSGSPPPRLSKFIQEGGGAYVGLFPFGLCIGEGRGENSCPE